MKLIKAMCIILILVSVSVTAKYYDTKTPNSDRTCYDIKGNQIRCNAIIYSGIRNVYEDNQWKRIEDAKSLKGSGIECVVISDGVHIAECLDYNYTHRKIRMSIESSATINKNNIPIKIINKEVDDITKELIPIEKSKNYIDLTTKITQWVKVDYSDTIHIGEESTTIQLQPSMADGYVDASQPNNNYMKMVNDMYMSNHQTWHYRVYTMFDLTSVPSLESVEDSKLCLYHHFNFGGSEDYGVHHVKNYSMAEHMSWNNQTCYTDFTSLECNQTAEDVLTITNSVNDWHCWNVTKATTYELVSNPHDNITLVLNNATLYLASQKLNSFRPREHGTAANRPYLNITYVEADSTPPVVTVTSPESITYPLNQDNITIDFTATDNTGISHLWYYNTSDNVSYTDGEPQGNILSNGTYTYFFYANDTSGNVGSANVTFNVSFDNTRDLQIWRNAATKSNVSKVDSNGDWSIGNRITFLFNEIIDNIVNGWIRITGNLNVTQQAEIGKNITMFSESGTKWNCGVNDAGEFKCT